MRWLGLLYNTGKEVDGLGYKRYPLTDESTQKFEYEAESNWYGQIARGAIFDCEHGGQLVRDFPLIMGNPVVSKGTTLHVTVDGCE